MFLSYSLQGRCLQDLQEEALHPRNSCYLYFTSYSRAKLFSLAPKTLNRKWYNLSGYSSLALSGTLVKMSALILFVTFPPSYFLSAKAELFSRRNKPFRPIPFYYSYAFLSHHTISFHSSHHPIPLITPSHSTHHTISFQYSCNFNSV